MVHAFQLLFIDCNYPRAFVWWIGMHAVMFFFLFKDFYNQSYSKPKVYPFTKSLIKLISLNIITYINVFVGARKVSPTRDNGDQRHHIQERLAEERLQQRAHERHVRAGAHRAARRQLTADQAPTLAFRTTL